MSDELRESVEELRETIELVYTGWQIPRDAYNTLHHMADRIALLADQEGPKVLRQAAEAFGHVWQADTVPAATVYQALRDRASQIEATP